MWPRRLSSQCTSAAALVATQIALCVWRLHGPVPSGLVADLVDWIGAQEAPFWIGYFAVGTILGHLAREGIALAHRRTATVVGIGLTAVGALLTLRVDPLSVDALRRFESGTGAFLMPQLTVLVAGVVIMRLAMGPLVERTPRFGAFVALVGRDALGMYITQVAILYPLGLLLLPSLESPFTLLDICGFLLLVALTFLCSMAATELLLRTRFAFVIGGGEPSGAHAVSATIGAGAAPSVDETT